MNRRKKKADFIREYRRSISDLYAKNPQRTAEINALVKGLAADEYGFPEKPTLADHYPLSRRMKWLHASSYKGEEGFNYYFCKGEVDEEEILSLFPAYYRGPGREFADKPHWEFNGYSTLVTQRVGLDI